MYPPYLYPYSYPICIRTPTPTPNPNPNLPNNYTVESLNRHTIVCSCGWWRWSIDQPWVTLEKTSTHRNNRPKRRWKNCNGCEKLMKTMAAVRCVCRCVCLCDVCVWMSPCLCMWWVFVFVCLCGCMGACVSMMKLLNLTLTKSLFLCHKLAIS